MAEASASLGLYIHIPFCLRKCAYCGFYSEAGHSPAEMSAYVDALLSEICWYGSQPALANRPVDTIFLGGGTPSLLPAAEIDRILSTLRDTFPVAPGAEITLECNPATAVTAACAPGAAAHTCGAFPADGSAASMNGDACSATAASPVSSIPTERDACEDRMTAWRAAGINRLSIGVQSLDAKILYRLGRLHTPADARRTVEAARRAGFANINLDVMFGIPGQTMQSWQETVEEILHLRPEHLSFYSLEIEEGTPFGQMLATGRLTETTPEEDRRMYHDLLRRLTRAGYEHYEISNAALPGCRCRHNMKYWTLQPYLGLGAAAHSYIDGRRLADTEDLTAYIQAMTRVATPPAAIFCRSPVLHPSPAVSADTRNSRRDDMTDLAFTALRLTDGIDKTAFHRRFGEAFWTAFPDAREAFGRLCAEGLAAEDETHVRITPSGMDIANTIIRLFLD